jgi:hypothetical protein
MNSNINTKAISFEDLSKMEKETGEETIKKFDIFPPLHKSGSQLKK